ncbi:MAG: hypothetical protein ACLQMF_20045 [Rectinemataceae bacterium]
MEFRKEDQKETAILTAGEKVQAQNKSMIEAIEALGKIGHSVESIAPDEDGHCIKIIVRPAVKSKEFYLGIAEENP